MAKCNIAIVDDHELFRDGLRRVCDNPSSQEFVVIEANDGQDLIDQIDGYSGEIDLVILDMNMPRLNGLQTLKWLRDHKPTLPTLFLSMVDDPAIIYEAMALGAGGYLLKSESTAGIKRAIRGIRADGYYYTPLVIQSLVEHFIRNSQSEDVIPTLTKKEKEVLTLLGSDRSYVEIAKSLNISPRTVDGYRDDLFKKFSVSSRIALVRKAIRYGLIIDSDEKQA